jgi:hypothetical protein
MLVAGRRQRTMAALVRYRPCPFGLGRTMLMEDQEPAWGGERGPACRALRPYGCPTGQGGGKAGALGRRCWRLLRCCCWQA